MSHGVPFRLQQIVKRSTETSPWALCKGSCFAWLDAVIVWCTLDRPKASFVVHFSWKSWGNAHFHVHLYCHYVLLNLDFKKEKKLSLNLTFTVNLTFSRVSAMENLGYSLASVGLLEECLLPLMSGESKWDFICEMWLLPLSLTNQSRRQILKESGGIIFQPIYSWFWSRFLRWFWSFLTKLFSRSWESKCMLCTLFCFSNLWTFYRRKWDVCSALLSLL